MGTLTYSQLLVGGDWACAHGDSEGLAYVVKLLSERLGDPVRGRLVELHHLCTTDCDLAASRWPVLRDEVAHRLQTAGS